MVFLTHPKSIFAIESPILLSPSNGATVTSSTLTWQVVTGAKNYRVIVDDELSASGSYIRSIYKTTTTYSPNIPAGTYYWKVEARDQNNVWGNWSSIWSFTLIDSLPSPTPSSTPTLTSSPTPAPSPTDSPISSFLISNIPSQINSDRSFKVTVNLSLPDSPNTDFFLKGAFKKSGSSNYFGMTKVSGNWVKNGSSYSNQFPITTDSSGNWSGNLEVKTDIDDSGFTGSGNYIFKVGRYKDSDNSSVTWSNESNIEITQTEGSNNADTSESTPQISSTNPTNSPLAQTKSTPPKVTSATKFNYRIASVAAATASATSSTKVSVKNQKQTNYFVWIGIIFIFAGTLSIGYIYLKSNAKIPNPFR